MSGARAAELHRIEDGIMLDIADCQAQLVQHFIELSRIRFEILATGATCLWTEISRSQTIRLGLADLV
jgi:hypothetical protein